MADAQKEYAKRLLVLSARREKFEAEDEPSEQPAVSDVECSDTRFALSEFYKEVNSLNRNISTAMGETATMITRDVFQGDGWL